MKVFVYGTLLRGMSRFSLLGDSQFMGLGFVKGVLYDLGDYPGIREGYGMVYGELYKIDNEKLSVLDNIEGYDPAEEPNSLYIRKKSTVTLLTDGSTEEAFTYFYNQDLLQPDKIGSGDYRRHRTERASDHQWYIAYGSNMNSTRLIARIGGVRGIKTGYLEGYDLVFNKKAASGGSYANIAYVGFPHQCPFVAYDVTIEQLRRLDQYEGEPSHYIRVAMPFLDLARESVIGHVYIANPGQLTQRQKPSSEYLGHIYSGYKEHGFDGSCLPR